MAGMKEQHNSWRPTLYGIGEAGQQMLRPDIYKLFQITHNTGSVEAYGLIVTFSCLDTRTTKRCG